MIRIYSKKVLPPISTTIYFVPGLETVKPPPGNKGLSISKCWQYMDAASGSSPNMSCSLGKPAYKQTFEFYFKIDLHLLQKI